MGKAVAESSLTSEEVEDEDAVLRQHFLCEGYSRGCDLDEIVAQDGGYALEITDRVPVYRHEELNIRVWRQALRLVERGEDCELFFHYMTHEDFMDVATAPCITAEIFRALKQACLESGLAIYAARREPAQLLAAYGGVDAKGKLPSWVMEADHCIPILVPASLAFNADFPQDVCVPMQTCPSRGRDLWTIQVASEAAALQAIATDHEHRFKSVLRTTEATLGMEHRDTLDAASYLAYVLDASGKQEAAEQHYRRALGGYEATLGADHPETLRCTSNLAALLQAQGRNAEAEPLARKSLAGLERTFGRSHPDTLASAGNLAHLLSHKGVLEEASGLFKRVLAWHEPRLSMHHQDTAVGASELAAHFLQSGSHLEAVRLEWAVLAWRENCLGYDHEDTLQSFRTLTQALLTGGGDLEEVEQVLRASLRAHATRYGDTSPMTFGVASSLASVLCKRGNLQAVKPLLCKACAWQEATLGKDHPDTVSSFKSLATLLVSLGEFPQAEALFQQLGEPMPEALRTIINTGCQAPSGSGADAAAGESPAPTSDGLKMKLGLSAGLSFSPGPSEGDVSAHGSSEYLPTTPPLSGRGGASPLRLGLSGRDQKVAVGAAGMPDAPIAQLLVLTRSEAHPLPTSRVAAEDGEDGDETEEVLEWSFARGPPPVDLQPEGFMFSALSGLHLEEGTVTTKI